jgi:hypothetical protein
LCVLTSPSAAAQSSTSKSRNRKSFKPAQRYSTHSMTCSSLLLTVTFRHLSSTYGSGWRVPDTSYHGVTQKAPDWWPIQQALLTRLAVTAWGDMTWPERRSRCDTSKAAATAAADLVAAKDPVITPAAGAGNPASDTKPGPARPQEQQPQDDQAYEAGPLLQATSDSTAGQLSQHPTPMPGQRKIMPS